jgi:hypothetical protein
MVGAAPGKPASTMRGKHMNRRSVTWGLLATGVTLFGSSSQGLAQRAGAPRRDAGRTTLFDGTSMANWSPIGDANWRIEDGAVVADKGNGFLVSNQSYGDFEIKAEFWVDSKANSGIFIRCSDPTKVTATNAYEVNIFDERPDPSYGTGAIVNVAKVVPMPKAGGKWNNYDITARGPRLSVVLNGQRTVNGVQDFKHERGWIALQYAAGVVKFRKVQIRSL